MLTLAVIGSLLLYLVQRKGWTYHLHGAVPLLAPLAALTWERLAPRPVPSAALAVAAVTALYGASLVRYDLGPGLTRAHEVGGHWNHDAMTAAAAIIAASPASDTVLTNPDWRAAGPSTSRLAPCGALRRAHAARLTPVNPAEAAPARSATRARGARRR
ncbi:MAG: hypothetical protein IV100_34750 [Myxococcales bacterium]|nr:hypothetical protein [Myxococcales bacterium]